MTSLRYFEDTYVTKLDGRYKGYNRGFRYRIQFRIGPRYDANRDPLWINYKKVLDLLENTYGKETEWHGEGVTLHRVWNENYRVETAKNKWFRHVYLRREQDVTMILLVAGQ